MHKNLSISLGMGIQMTLLLRATLWMKHNQVFTWHLTFLCGTVTLQNCAHAVSS